MLFQMEDPKKFAVPSIAYTSQTSQPNFGAASENRGQLHTIRMLPSDKPSNNAPLPSGGLPASSAHGHVSAAPPAPLAQPLTTDVKASSASTGLASSHLGRDSSALVFPRVEKTQGASNGATYMPQVQGNPPLSLFCHSDNLSLLDGVTIACFLFFLFSVFLADIMLRLVSLLCLIYILNMKNVIKPNIRIACLESSRMDTLNLHVLNFDRVGAV